MKIPLPKYRQLACQIATTDLSNRRLGVLNRVSHNTIGQIRTRLKDCPLPWEELAKLPDDAFAACLKINEKQNASSRIIPDWSLVHKELQGRDITLQLLHTEYLHSLEHAPETALRYTQFCARYKRWKKSQRISMRQTHKPGQKMFVDFCGATVPVLDTSSNEFSKAQIFVAVLGASNYTFAYAVPSQRIPDWLECHVKALQFFGGAPAQFVPDNLKSAIISNSRDSLVINSSYADLANHYDVAINPARPRKPKDKAKAEVGVQIVQRWVLAPMRNQVFTSIDELNIAIRERVRLLNDKKSRVRPESRREAFLRVEQPALRKSENGHYETGQWRYNVRVPETYHVEFDGSYYSVPYQYTNHIVSVRGTYRTVEILLNDFRIASHSRRKAQGKSTHDDHMPANHLKYESESTEDLLNWAAEVGPDAHEWAKRQISERQNFANGIKAVRELKRISKNKDSLADINLACAFGIKFKILSISKMRNIIAKRLYEAPLRDASAWIKEHSNLRGKYYFVVNSAEKENVE